LRAEETEKEREGGDRGREKEGKRHER